MNVKPPVITFSENKLFKKNLCVHISDFYIQKLIY